MSIECQNHKNAAPEVKNQETVPDRREFIGKLLMGSGLLVSYGTLAVEGGLFLMPPDKEVATRQLFVGKTDHFSIGQVKEAYDLQGNLILIKRRSEAEFQAFSSVCPHLGCRVNWQEEEKQFFCPCHNGVFDAEGVALSGPPAKAGQKLAEVSVVVDDPSQRVYIEVRDITRRS